nr:hypothetical protein [Nostoc sp. DedQUE02]
FSAFTLKIFPLLKLSQHPQTFSRALSRKAVFRLRGNRATCTEFRHFDYALRLRSGQAQCTATR